jgi:hypothetical protein
LGGVADHLLCRHATIFGLRGLARGLLTFDFLLPDMGLLQRGEQDREQVVGEGGEVSLGVCGDRPIRPGFLLMELVLEDIEDLFDLPTQEIEERARRKGVMT